MFRTYPLALEFIEAHLIIDAQSPRSVRIGAPLLMNRVAGVQHLIFRVIRLAGKYSGRGCRSGKISISIVRRKLISAIRTHPVTGMDERQTLRTLFRRSLAALSHAGFPDPDHVHGAVPENISAVIENQAIAFPFANPGPATDHLNKKSRGIGRTQQHDTVGIRCIEPRGQHIHIDQEPQRRFVAEEIVRHRLALESGNDFSTFS